MKVKAKYLDASALVLCTYILISQAPQQLDLLLVRFSAKKIIVPF